MKVGDLVRYRGWMNYPKSEPLAIVTDTRSDDSAYHARIRVMWVGEKIPIQARALSVHQDGSRITTWISPKHFEVVSEGS